MNLQLIDRIDAKITEMGNFVINYMPVDIDTDTAYEEMLACSVNNTAPMIAAFREAVKYLHPQANFKRFNFSLPDGRIATIQARFNPTQKWPVFMMPTGNLTVDPEGKFAALLDTPIRVATEWESLAYVWQRLRLGTYGLDVAQLTYLLPWIRECLADFYPGPDTSKSERKIIVKELAAIMNDADVPFFPRMSKALSAVARSGTILFSQYRIIDAAYDHRTLTISPITVERTPSLLEQWLKDHLAEALEEWALDKSARHLRQYEAINKRAAVKLAALAKLPTE